MVIRMFPLVVRVLTPFFWTERGFTGEHFEEGRFSIGSLLPFRPPLSYPPRTLSLSPLTSTPLLPYRGYNSFGEVVHGGLLPGAAWWDIFRHEADWSESREPCMYNHQP